MFLAIAILWSALSDPCAVNFVLARCGPLDGAGRIGEALTFISLWVLADVVLGVIRLTSGPRRS